MCVLGALRGQKEVLGALGLSGRELLRYHIGTRKQTRVLCKIKGCWEELSHLSDPWWMVL